MALAPLMGGPSVSANSYIAALLLVSTRVRQPLGEALGQSVSNAYGLSTLRTVFDAHETSRAYQVAMYALKHWRPPYDLKTHWALEVISLHEGGELFNRINVVVHNVCSN